MEEEEGILQRPREARQGPTVAEPAPPAGTPCDAAAEALLAPAVQMLSSSDDEEEGELEFEFPFVSRDSPAGTAAPADELFADGRIRTLYPVFGRGAGGHDARGSSSSSRRSGGHIICASLPAAAAPPRVRGQLGRLFLEETRERNSSTSSTASSSSSSSGSGAAATEDDGLDGAAPESYCVWRPGGGSSASLSATPRKSGSTGSMARWRRISDLVVGRSHSDGREKFLFLAAAAAPPPHVDAPRRKKTAATATAPAGASRKPPSSAAAADSAAHRIAYLARGGGLGGLGGGVPVPPGGGTPRRTFLPYREELVGFFANVHGISRSHHHPF